MGGVGGIVVAVFGVIWTFGALSMGAPPFMALFGVVFVLMAIGGALYNFFNATSKNRLSTFDVTTGSEESDPLADALGHTPSAEDQQRTGSETPRCFAGGFCPFCGTKVEASYAFCPHCGKTI
jgi:xanthosine utilization system XapX-like protein